MIERGQGYYNLARRKNRWQEGDLKMVRDFISSKLEIGEARSLLEIGCGEAELLEHIAGLVYTGLDPTIAVLEKNRKRYPDQKFVVGQAEYLPFVSGGFDVVFSAQTIQFFNDPPKAFAEMARVVKPGGYVIVLAPNLEWPRSRISAIKHYPAVRKFVFFVTRIVDLIRRSVGQLPFRIIEQNYFEKTGQYEHGDEDLKYVTSAYEVATFFRRQGFRMIFRKPAIKPRRLKDYFKLLINFIPVLRYYQGGMFFVFQK